MFATQITALFNSGQVEFTQGPLLTHVIDVKATNTDVIALDKSGTVTLFINGEVGKKLNLPGKVVKITAGCEHGACLLEDGQVYIWGSFENPGYTFREPYKPARLLRDEKMVDIASGRDHLVALTHDGAVFTMGCAAHGQLGRIARRSAEDGGRHGARMLLVPHKMHTTRNGKADRIWATRRGTFYRDLRTGVVFGCGENRNQNVSPQKVVHANKDFIYKPVATIFKDVKYFTDTLLTTGDGDLYCRPRSRRRDTVVAWSSLDERVLSIQQSAAGRTTFIGVTGDVCEFLLGENFGNIYKSSENDHSPALAYCETETKGFVVIVN